MRSETGTGSSILRGVTVLEFLIMLAILAILVLLLLPGLSFADPRVLAEGVVLYNGAPVAGTSICFRPVRDDGSFGDEAMTRDDGPGRFQVVTFSSWRRSNSSAGLFVANLQLDPALLTDDEEEQQRLVSYLNPESSPLRFQIPEGGLHDLRIELGAQTTD